MLPPGSATSPTRSRSTSRLAITGRGLDQEDLFFDRRGRLDQHLCRRLDGGRGMTLQHRAQRSGEQVPEHPLRRRGVRRGLSLPARHVGQNLRGEADEVEESLGEIGGSVVFRDRERPGRGSFAPYSGGSGPSSSCSTIPKLISPPCTSASSALSSRATDAISSRKT